MRPSPSSARNPLSPLSQNQTSVTSQFKSFFSTITESLGFNVSPATQAVSEPAQFQGSSSSSNKAHEVVTTPLVSDKGKGKVKWGTSTVVYSPDHDQETNAAISRLQRANIVDEQGLDELDAIRELEVNQDNFAIILKAGRILLENNDCVGAQEHFDNLIPIARNNLQMQPELADAYIDLGRKLFHQNNGYKKAQDSFAKSMELLPDNLNIRISIAAFYQQEINRLVVTNPAVGYLNGDVVAQLQAAIEIDPNHAEANFMLAKHYCAEGSPGKAIPFLQRTTLSEPNNVEAFLLLGRIHYKRGEEFQQRKNREAAAKDFNQAFDAFSAVRILNPRDIEVQFSLGKIYFARKDLNLAGECFNKVLELDPAHTEAGLSVAALADLKGSISKVQQNLTEAWEEYDKAEKALQEARRHNPLDPHIDIAEQNLRFKWGELGVDNVYEGLDQDVWLTITTLGVADNPTISEAILKEKGQEPFKQYGNKVNGRNQFGQTPLHGCIGSLHLVRKLVEEYHADVNTLDDNGDSPIMVAASMGQLEVVRLLLAQGANLEIKNRDGNNIFHLMAMSHTSETSRDLREVAVTLINHLRIEDQSVEQSDLILDEVAGKGKKKGGNLMLHLLTDKNKLGKNVRELAKAKNQDLIALFEEAIELILNERITGIFQKAYTIRPKGDSYELSYVADEEKAKSFAMYTTFLRKYLPLFPDSAFAPSAECTSYKQVLKGGAFFTFIIEKLQYANTRTLDGILSQEGGFSQDQTAAINAVNALIDLVCQHGYIYVDPAMMRSSATVLQPHSSSSSSRTATRSLDAHHDGFWVLIPQRVMNEHFNLMQQVYQRIFRRMVQEVISYYRNPEVEDSQEQQNKGYWSMLWWGTKDTKEAGIDQMQGEYFHLSGTLVQVLFNVLESHNIERYKNATEDIRIKMDEFLKRLTMEIIMLGKKIEAKYQSDKTTEVVKTLIELSNIFTDNPNEQVRKTVLAECIARIKQDLGIANSSRKTRAVAFELDRRYQAVNEEGAEGVRLPLSAMLRATGKTSCELMADVLDEAAQSSLVLQEVDDLEATLTQKVSQLHRPLFSKGNLYRKICALESLLEVNQEHTNEAANLKVFAQLWVFMTGIPPLPIPGWANKVAEVWVKNRERQGTLVLTHGCSSTDFDEWNMNTLVAAKGNSHQR